MLYAILAESKSDFRTLVALLRSLKKNPRLPVKGKGYRSRGELLTKGASDLRKLIAIGCTHAVICTDADGPNPRPAYDTVDSRIVRASGAKIQTCIVIPTQELESWILADMAKVRVVIKSFKPKAIANPELVASPKEELARLSRARTLKPLYNHVVHNEQVAKYLDLEEVYRKCPSFRPLYEFVTGRKPT